jgi:LL-diaminopimelate aminotransferase
LYTRLGLTQSVLEIIGKDERVPSTSSSLFQASSRLTHLPPYVFAWLDDLKAEARAKGADLIDLGMGNPDQPTPKAVVEAIQQAFATSHNHGYPPFKGKDTFRQAVSRWMKRRYQVNADPQTDILCLSGSKEGLAHLAMA